MSRHLLLAGALFALGVAACTDDRASEPTSPDLMVGATCRYSDVKKFAKNLFGSPSTGATLAQQMSGFAKDSPQATTIAFQIFAEIAKKRNATTNFSAFVTDAANLTLETANCANVSAGTDAVTLDAFTRALGPSGGYAVPAAEALTVLAKDGQASVNAPGGKTFGDWLSGGPALVYGYVPASATGPNESQDKFTGRKVYTWSFLRPVGAPALVGKGSVSLCIAYDNLDPSINPDQFRVEKLTNILEIKTNSLGCDPLLLASATAVPTGYFASLVHRVGTWLAPEPAHAVLAGTRTPTGGAGNFSDFYVVNPNSVNLSFTEDGGVAPADGTLNGGIPGVGGGIVTVVAEGAGGTPWTDVLLHIYGINNNGAKVEFTGSCATTDDAGKALFPNLKAPKNGGYNLFVETLPTLAGCNVDPDVVGFAKVTLQAPDRINVRP